MDCRVAGGWILNERWLLGASTGRRRIRGAERRCGLWQRGCSRALACP